MRWSVRLQGRGVGIYEPLAAPGAARPPLQGLPELPTGCSGWVGRSHEVIRVPLCSFPAKKYKKVTGKEIYSDTLESTPMLEKEKFPQDYFPEVGPRPPAASAAVGWRSSRPRISGQGVASQLPTCPAGGFSGRS